MDIKAFRGLSGTYNVKANERDRGTPRHIECLVQFLNNTQHKFIIDKRSKGQCLLESVFRHLNLIETDFFGLKYYPEESQSNNNNNHIENNNANNTVFSSTPLPYSHNHHTNGTSSPNASLSSSTITSEPSNHNHINGDDTGHEFPHVEAANSSSPDYQHHNHNHHHHHDNNNHQTIKTNDNEKHNSDKTSKNRTERNDRTNSTLSEERWLDPTKCITKQCKPGPPYVFYFRVKFYVSDPCKLADDTTRYHLYLQLRQDILNSRLIVTKSSAILLASYILQSEVGDYRRDLLESDYASKFKLLPNQDDDIKKKVIELHKTHKSLSAADAEYQFLEHAAKKLDCYGVEFFDAEYLDETTVRIGVSANGIVVMIDNKKMNQFMWAKIVKIMFKKKIFSIQLRRDDGVICDNLIEYNLLTNHACKSFWEECVAQHSFFRLHQPKNPPKKFFSFLNFGSKFQYNGKTEYQTMEESRKRSFSHFSRTPSKRYARRTVPIGRPSWSNSSNDNNQSTDNVEQPISAMSLSLCEASGPSRHDIRDGASSVSPTTSASGQQNGTSVTKSTSAYRPKSLTLKSIMYIDEPKINQSDVDTFTGMSQEHEQGDTGTKDVLKKDLKRCESLRIPSSIRDAILLTKKAGASSSNQLSRISETLKDKFLARKSKTQQQQQASNSKNQSSNIQSNSDDLETGNDETTTARTPSNIKVVRLYPKEDGKYGFKIRDPSAEESKKKKSKKSAKPKRPIIVLDVTPDSPAAIHDPPLCGGDQIVNFNGISTAGLSETEVRNMIQDIQKQKDPKLVLEILVHNSETCSMNTYNSHTEASSSQCSVNKTLAESIADIGKALSDKTLESDFEKLSRRNEDESLSESRAKENIDKNRYQDILPYDSTRVQLSDSMTGDYINASFVDMQAPSGMLNRYIATQGPLSSTCDDFWQMIWEQNCSLIIMVTPLIEGGRVKCHKYWPDEKEEIKYGQLLIRNISEKSKTATIDRTIQLVDVKSGEKRITTQIQYRSWPDHQVPADCSDFLKLVNRVRKHRLAKPDDPIVVHCSAGIGRTGVLILMETAICIMEAGEPIYPLRILENMRRKRAMLIQTRNQFTFVAGAICKVYYQKLYKKSRKKQD